MLRILAVRTDEGNYPAAKAVTAPRTPRQQLPGRLRIAGSGSQIPFERLADTVQTDHFDWGYHISLFYGSDYRFTTAKGYFSQQLLLSNRQYGFDPVMEYVDFYLPRVAQGLDIRVGRYISVPDIEAQLAPNNYMFTHSLLYTIDPFTDTGILGTVKLNNHWLVQLGLTVSHDVAPWSSDAQPAVTACWGLHVARRQRQSLCLREWNQQWDV